MKNMIWRDLGFFVERLSELSVSRSILLESGLSLGYGFCVSVGSYAENWVYFPGRITSLDYVVKAKKFFEERGETFMWPVYDGGTEFLEEAGLVYAGDITAMSLDPKNARLSRVNPDLAGVRIEHLMCDFYAKEWAETAWRVFGGEGDVPEEYCRFVDALRREGESLSRGGDGISLHWIMVDKKVAGTFALTEEAEMIGVYYFGTLPECRRMGVASAMMNKICSIAGERRIVLQSTPMGLGFYRSFGFTELFKIPVYSTDKDIL